MSSSAVPPPPRRAKKADTGADTSTTPVSAPAPSRSATRTDDLRKAVSTPPEAATPEPVAPEPTPVEREAPVVDVAEEAFEPTPNPRPASPRAAEDYDYDDLDESPESEDDPEPTPAPRRSLRHKVKPPKTQSDGGAPPANNSSDDSASAKKGGVLAVVGSRKRARLMRYVGLGVGAGVVVLGGALTVSTWMNPPASTEETAAIAAKAVAGDGAYAAYESAGKEFLTAFLSYSDNTETQKTLDAIVSTWGAPGASKWRAQNATAPVAVEVLSAEPVTGFTPSSTIPGARSAVYRVQTRVTTTDERNGKVTEEISTGLYSVTVGNGEDEFGRQTTVVLAPPAELVDSATVAIPDAGTEPTPLPGPLKDQMTEFLRLWMQAGPNATPDLNTALTPWLAADADSSTRRGLDGALTLDRITGTDVTKGADGRLTGWVEVAAQTPYGQTTTRRWKTTLSVGDGGELKVHEMWIG